MNNLPIEGRLDILANAVGSLGAVIERLIEHVPDLPHESDDYERILTNLEQARADAQRCMEV